MTDTLRYRVAVSFVAQWEVDARTESEANWIARQEMATALGDYGRVSDGQIASHAQQIEGVKDYEAEIDDARNKQRLAEEDREAIRTEWRKWTEHEKHLGRALFKAAWRCKDVLGEQEAVRTIREIYNAANREKAAAEQKQRIIDSGAVTRTAPVTVFKDATKEESDRAWRDIQNGKYLGARFGSEEDDR